MAPYKNRRSGAPDRRRQYRYGLRRLSNPTRPEGALGDTVLSSQRKERTGLMLEWRLEAYRRWLTMTEPKWARVHIPRSITRSSITIRREAERRSARSTRSIRKSSKPTKSSAFPARGRGAGRRGAPRGERRIAVDAVFDSVSVATTFQKRVKTGRRDLMPISEAIREHPDLVKKYIGTVCRPRTIICHVELRRCSPTARRLCAAGRALPDGAVHLLSASTSATPPVRGTLIIAARAPMSSYLEGCTAPHATNQFTPPS